MSIGDVLGGEINFGEVTASLARDKGDRLCPDLYSIASGSGADGGCWLLKAE